ncbi:MAG: hypothetical protein ACTHNH_20995 [Mesorhizobium sp.]
MSDAITALTDKLQHDLKMCGDIASSLRSGVMQTFEVDRHGQKTDTSQERIRDYEQMAENLKEVLAKIEAAE